MTGVLAVVVTELMIGVGAELVAVVGVGLHE